MCDAYFRAIQGVATLGSLKSKLLKGKVQPTDAVSKATFTTFKKVTLDTTLEKLDRILDREHFAFVVHQQRLCELQLVLRASSGFPASYLTCGSSIIQVILASFKYLLEHKVFEIFSFINNSSSNNCLPNVFIQEIIIAQSKKLKKNVNFKEILL